MSETRLGPVGSRKRCHRESAQGDDNSGAKWNLNCAASCPSHLKSFPPKLKLSRFVLLKMMRFLCFPEPRPSGKLAGSGAQLAFQYLLCIRYFLIYPVALGFLY